MWALLGWGRAQGWSRFEVLQGSGCLLVGGGLREVDVGGEGAARGAGPGLFVPAKAPGKRGGCRRFVSVLCGWRLKVEAVARGSSANLLPPPPPPPPCSRAGGRLSSVG